MEGKLKAEGLMVKVMNGGFPRVAKFVSIFTVKFVRIVFDFHGFSNETGGVMRGRV